MHPEVSVVSGVDPFAAPLRVLHVHQPESGGVARYVDEAADHQARHGWEVHVASPRAEEALRQREPGQGRQVRPAPHLWRSVRAPHRGLVGEVVALQSLVSKVAPDVVVLHSAKAGLVGRLALRGRVPTVFVPHAWSFVSQRPPVSTAAMAWERVAGRWTSMVVAVGDAEAERGVRAGVRGPFAVVRNPVPSGWQRTARTSMSRRVLGLDVGPLAVSIGRLSRQKGHDLLLDAWPRVSATVPGARLLVVGDGEWRARLVARRVPGVTFVGAQDPRAYVVAADVVVIPSRWEGCSLVMLEAMATGRSVVTTAVDGSEVVRDAMGGAVVPVGDVKAMAASLVDRLSGRVDTGQEGARAAAYVETRHAREVSLHRLAAFISRADAFGAPST